MWFCEMRRMPRLRDCFYELASDFLHWLGDRVDPRMVRIAHCPVLR